METLTLFLLKEDVYKMCVNRLMPATYTTSDVSYEYAGDCGLRLTTSVQLQLKKSTYRESCTVDDIHAIHVMRPSFTSEELRRVLPMLRTFGAPLYVYSTLKDFKAQAVEYANSVPIQEGLEAKVRLKDPVLDVHAWLFLMATATKSNKALSQMIASPRTKHVKELIQILERTKGSKHALMTLNSRLHNTLTGIEEFGDINSIEATEYKHCQQLRELMTRQGMSVSKLPKFLYHAIRNVSIRDTSK